MTKQELEALLHEIRDLPVDDFAVAGRVASITAQISEEFARLRAADEPRADCPECQNYRDARMFCCAACGKRTTDNRQAEPTREYPTTDPATAYRTTCNHPPEARGLTGCLLCGASL